jgi:predicted transposase YbfD/YdcC
METAMPQQQKREIPSLYAVLEEIPDWRQAQGRRHPLAAMLSVACVALLCGRQTILGIAEWVADYGKPYLKRFGFTYPEPPGQATWYRVLGGIEWAELEARTCAWAQQVLDAYGAADALQGVAIDGKTLRGSKKQGATDAHLLSAVGQQLVIVLAQVAVADKTNEIPTAIELLSHLVIAGHVFTMDALLTQREIATTILAGKGDYVFVVKNNQPHLRADLELLFTSPPPLTRYESWPTAQTTALGHGRIETRRLQTTTALNDYLDWPGVQQVFKLVRQRTDKKAGTSTTETIYGLTSLAATRTSAAQLLSLTRHHWTIENQVHWVRDVVFDEDAAQTRRAHLPHIMATLRNLVISLLHANDIHRIARARRHFAARPDEALALLAIPA